MSTEEFTDFKSLSKGFMRKLYWANWDLRDFRAQAKKAGQLDKAKLAELKATRTQIDQAYSKVKTYRSVDPQADAKELASMTDLYRRL